MQCLRLATIAALLLAGTRQRLPAADSSALGPAAERALQLITARVGRLTDPQRALIGAILHAAAQRGEALRRDPQLSGQTGRKQLGALIQATAGRIRALLGPDQQEQFDLLVRSMGRD
ncbi:MAG TPA: hypothetical protein VHC86_02710 [Opitutaceae bacterium]|nr:hypothetical protein [Opitutaceae bacterium]